MAQDLITGVTNYWCRTKQFHSIDLETHPQMDDVILLIKFRDEYWKEMNKSQKTSFHCFFEWAYKRKNQLRQKHLIKLKQIVLNLENNRLAKNLKLEQHRSKIKNLRQLTL
jgi:hypothetical protein